MDAQSLGSSLANAAKVALGAVLLAGDAIRATISDEGGTPAPEKQRGAKKRRMKRRKAKRPPDRP